MKELKEILYQVRIEEVVGSTDIEIGEIQFDSRKVRDGDLFVAVKGTKMDGHQFIPEVIAQGAVAIVCEELPEKRSPEVTYVRTMDARLALAQLAANYYDNPSEKLNLVGITGTNGKTTSVSLLHSLFQKLGHKSGMISTIDNRIGNRVAQATHTTPDPLQINQLLSDMVAEGCSYCFMEASSHAIDQKRTAGLHFTGAVFTNITHDHLDYHKTFDAYIKAKQALFDGLSSESFALYNADDKHGKVMVQNSKATRRSFGIRTLADYKGKIIENQFSGLHLKVDGHDLYTPLIGKFNAYNLLGVYATAMLLGQGPLEVLTAISTLKPAEGRFQYLKAGNDITAIIDYAHTPDALENVLKTISEVRGGNEKVITVVGCGGNRDTAKRPQMARLATEYSDRVVLTSDNPRHEQPGAIIEDMQKGVEAQNQHKTIAVENRREAIKLAVSLAEANDIILVAGKGHEKYQEVGDERLPFDDVEVLRETFKMLEK